MDDLDGGVGFLGGLVDPGMAAGVAGGDKVGAGGFDIGPFTIEELAGHLGLEEVVGSGGTAAHFGLGEFGEGDSGDGLDEVAGLLADFLAVGEVAGVVVGDGDVGEAGGGFELFEEAVLEEKFGEVEGVFGEALLALADDGAVFFEGGSAAGGVDDDGEVFGEVSGEVLGVFFGFGEVSGVGVEGATASGISFADGEADAAEESAGGEVDVGIEDAHDAAFEEVDLAFDFREGFGVVWGKGGEVLGGRGGGFGGLAADEVAEGGGDGFGGEGGSEEELELAEEGVGGGVEEVFAGLVLPGLEVVGLLAGEFDDFSVLDAGGAGGFAGPATEAGVEGGLGVGLPLAGFGGGPGEGDASAWGLAFVGGELEGGTGLQAEPAPDALGGEVAEVRHGVRVPGLDWASATPFWERGEVEGDLDGGLGEEAGGVEGGEGGDLGGDEEGDFGAAEGDGVAALVFEVLDDVDELLLGFGGDLALAEFVEDGVLDGLLLWLVRGEHGEFVALEGGGVDGAVRGPFGAEEGDFGVSVLGGGLGDDFGDVESREGEIVFGSQGFEGDVGGVVGADEEVAFGLGETLGGLVEVAVDLVEVVTLVPGEGRGHGEEGEGNFGVVVGGELAGGLADGFEEAEGGAVGGVAEDSDVAEHGSGLPKVLSKLYRNVLSRQRIIVKQRSKSGVK